MEAGTRLQWPQFLHALEAIAAKKAVGLDTVIYKVASKCKQHCFSYVYTSCPSGTYVCQPCKNSLCVDVCALLILAAQLMGDGSPPAPLQGGKGGNRAYRLTVLEDAIPRFIEVGP